MSTSWLEHLIQQSAWEMEVARKSIFQFGNQMAKALFKNPVQSWEADLWARGLKQGLIRLEGHFFRVGQGKHSPLSFFIRNEQGLYVGFRRESITQAATYVSLVTDHGYTRMQTRFESRWMDVAVYDDKGEAWIYAENKAQPKTLERLCDRLSEEFAQGVPRVEEEDPKVDDAVMKANHIWKNRPRYFWGVCPTGGKIYEITYSANGFGLQGIAALPTAHEWKADYRTAFQ